MITFRVEEVDPSLERSLRQYNVPAPSDRTEVVYAITTALECGHEGVFFTGDVYPVTKPRSA